MLVLEALRARYGDALLLHFGTPAEPRLALIDGGPPGVWSDAVKPRPPGGEGGRRVLQEGEGGREEVQGGDPEAGGAGGPDRAGVGG